MKKFVSNQNVFIMDGAHVMGDIEFGKGCSVWYGAVLRGDCGPIRLGEMCNIQDNAVLHGDGQIPTILEEGVTVGHNATVHSAYVGAHTLIGMNAVLISGCRVGRCCIVGAGTVITPKMDIPDYSMVVGNPARIVRSLSPEEIEYVSDAGRFYYELSKTHETISATCDKGQR